MTRIEALPRVAIVAEHASARFGGEAILPFHYFRLLRRRGIKAHLVVHERTREELEQLLPDEREVMHFVRDLPVQRALWSLQRRLPARVGENTVGVLLHFVTQLRQRRVVCGLIARGLVDLVHEPSPVSPKLPSILFGVGAPVIVGPLNGGMSFPPGFTSHQRFVERLFLATGRFFARFIHYLIPGKRNAALVLVANERTRRALPAGLRGRVAQLVENGVDLELFADREHPGPSSSSVCRFVFVGRLVEWKAVDVLLQAFARVRVDLPVELWVIGDGEDRAILEERARSLGIVDSTVFHGFVPQTRCPELLAQCDALVLPSLYECGGAVVLEAMAMKLPVIATSWGGPADYVDPSCGRLVEPSGGRRAFCVALEVALREIAGSAELRERLGAAGVAKVRQQFDWQRKLDAILEHYAEVLHSSGDPDRLC